MQTIELYNNGKKSYLYLYIDEFLKRRNISHKKLAEHLGKSAQQTSNLKFGHSKGIHWDDIIKMCELFKCQPGELFQLNNISENSMKKINDRRPLKSERAIKKTIVNNTITTKVSPLYYHQDDKIIIFSPEINIFLSIEENSKKTPCENIKAAIKKEFRSKKINSLESFIITMQENNHWYYSEEKESFHPLTLDYYIDHYDMVREIVRTKDYYICHFKAEIKQNKRNLGLTLH